MKRKLNTRLYRLVPLLALFIITSCKKDNDESSYYGSWLTRKTIPMIGSSPYVSVVYYLEISENEFVESFADYPSEISLRYIVIKGSFSAAENFMEFTPKRISFSWEDFNKEPYATYSDEEEKFENYIAGLRTIVSRRIAEYNFTGDTLTLVIKYKEFSDSPEYVETVKYTRP